MKDVAKMTDAEISEEITKHIANIKRRPAPTEIVARVAALIDEEHRRKGTW